MGRGSFGGSITYCCRDRISLSRRGQNAGYAKNVLLLSRGWTRVSLLGFGVRLPPSLVSAWSPFSWKTATIHSTFVQSALSSNKKSRVNVVVADVRDWSSFYSSLFNIFAKDKGIEWRRERDGEDGREDIYF